jgi:hypothetical protein
MLDKITLINALVRNDLRVVDQFLKELPPVNTLLTFVQETLDLLRQKKRNLVARSETTLDTLGNLISNYEQTQKIYRMFLKTEIELLKTEKQRTA